MSKKHLWGFCSLFILIMFINSSWILAQTEETIPSVLVHACIQPITGSPYLVTFRDADMPEHTVGFLVPEKATVTIYGSTNQETEVGIYSITTDAGTGGYRWHGTIAEAFARLDIPLPSARPCATEFPTIITPDLPLTIPLPVSQDQAVLIRFGGEELPDPTSQTTFPGVFTFHFRPITGETGKDFQIIQLSGGGIEVSFPFLTDNPRFVLIANKDVRLRTSFTQQPGDFLSQAIANPLPGFEQSLARELVGGESNETLNLYRIMEEGVVRIYPAFGIVLVYPSGGFLRLEMSPLPPETRSFPEGVAIRRIDGVDEFCYVAQNDHNVTGCTSARPSKIVGVNENGELIVKLEGGPNLIVTNSWLMEAATGQ